MGKILMEFISPHCPICRSQTGLIKQLCSKYGKLKHQIIDITKNPGLAQQYHVMGLPSYLFIEGNNVISNHSGKISEKKFEKDLTFWLKKG